MNDNQITWNVNRRWLGGMFDNMMPSFNRMLRAANLTVKIRDEASEEPITVNLKNALGVTHAVVHDGIVEDCSHEFTEDDTVTYYSGLDQEYEAPVMVCKTCKSIYDYRTEEWND